jgi:NDP-sugar pyrophosphorylase family protein
VIEEAVILAAGRGARLGALTANRPKALLEVGGRPAVLRIADGLARAGAARIVVVVGHLGDAVEAAFREFASAETAFARQTTLDGTARALARARPLLGDGPFLFSWADILVEPRNYARVASAGAAGAVLAVNDVDDPAEGAAVYADGKMRIQRIVEKPRPGTSTTRWNNAGFGVLPHAIWGAIERLEPSPRGEYELPRAIASLIERGEPFRAAPVVGPWFDIGTPDSLRAARASFAGVTA